MCQMINWLWEIMQIVNVTNKCTFFKNKHVIITKLPYMSLSHIFVIDILAISHDQQCLYFHRMLVLFLNKTGTTCYCTIQQIYK